METPASLLERLRRPAQDRAWARFVEQYTPLLYHWARRGGCAESDAADLVQEVFALLVRKLPEFHYDGQKSFRAWLHTLAQNCWRNLRRRAALPRAAGAADLGQLPAPAPTDPLSEEDYRQRLVGRALALMQSDFEPTTWKACWECVVAGRPAVEVAQELGVRVGTVYAAKSRVLSRLRLELAEARRQQRDADAGRVRAPLRLAQRPGQGAAAGVIVLRRRSVRHEPRLCACTCCRHQAASAPLSGGISGAL